MATVRTQPKVIKASEVVDTSRAGALDPHNNWKRALAARASAQSTSKSE